MKKIRYSLFFVFFYSFTLFPFLSNAQQSGFTSPEEYFGFRPGDDRKLFDYEELIAYLQKLDDESPKLKLEEIGKSPMGKPMYIAFLSSEENIQNLEPLKKINHELALNPDLSEADREQMSKNGRVFVLATLSMHSGEVGPSQSAALVAHDLVSTTNKETVNWLDDVVYMMVPCHNPDGMDMIVHNYRKNVGTKYEGAALPRVYHKYVGHDNNRDFVILSQEDSRAIAKVYNQTWLPQVMVEKHQMGSTGTRYFVPPNHDPIAQNIDAGMWTWVGIFGQNMFNDMTNEGLAGVSQHYIFDNYWPGSTETCLWNNVISFLTECASSREATPIYIESNELAVRGKGLSEYKKSINMPLPWEGGWWRLGDIVKYEISSTMSIIKTASLYKEKILLFRNDMCRREIAKGTSEPPYYYIVPRNQHDESELVNLVNLVRDHGIKVYTLKNNIQMDGSIFLEGDFVIPLAQPYRALIKEIMEAQEYPVRHYTPGGDIIKPYDITSWSLPLHRQVKSFEIKVRDSALEEALIILNDDLDYSVPLPESFFAAVYSVNDNESFKAAFIAMENGMKLERLTKEMVIEGKTLPKGSFVIYNSRKSKSGWDKISEALKIEPVFIKEEKSLESTLVRTPRIALVETFFHDMDAGWARFVFDTYHIKYTVLNPGDIPNTNLSENYDIIIFADDAKSQLMTGKSGSSGSYYMSSYHPDYVKGMEKKGLGKLMLFIENGGLVLSWGKSTALFEGMQTISKGDVKEEFQLPVRDISSNLQKDGLYVAGSLLKIKLLKDHPLTMGLPDEIGVFSRGRPVFATSIPRFDMDRRVIGKYADKNVLLSGYIEKPEKLADRSAMVWLKKGKGQIVLYGFSPQFRSSTQGSFKLLFNALLLNQ